MFANLRSLLTQPAIVSSAIITALLFGVQRLGVLQPVEFKAFDQMVQMRSDPGPDPRILVVGVTEKDLQKLQKWPLTGEILDNLFSKLEGYQPRVIGVDIFRDLRVDPGHDKLLKHLQQSDRIISVCKHSDSTNAPTPPPAGTQPEQVGFSDVVEDTDDIIRRNLLLVNPESASPCNTPYSLGLQLALHYLGNIPPKFTPKGELQLGTTVFTRLKSDSGGYQNVDANGYQILLNYRSANRPVQEVSVSDVLSGQIDPASVKDRVVLVGSTAPSIKDVFNTPYSSSQRDNQKTPGVVVQAQMASQILSVVLNKQPLFWFLPEWGEVLWIWVWTLAGGVLAWRIQHPLRLGIAGGVSLGGLLASNFVIFTHAGWVPVVPPALGLVLATGSVIAYSTFRTKQEQEKIARQVKEQERTIALLQVLLKEGGNTTDETRTGSNVFQKDAFLNQRYKVTQFLGSGGFGKAYLAEDTQRPGNPLCVVKHLQPAREDEQFLEVARRLFKTEGEILELLGKHNQIPQLLACFEENQQFYLVQEFIQGHSFSEEVKPGIRLSEAEVIDFLRDILPVLAFVHSHHVIHRDIKPGNLIRRKQDHHLVLIDFGAVKQIQSQQQQYEENQSIAIGTAGYSPPEQLMGHPRLNSDIYALGMIAIQALTGTAAKKFQRNPNTGGLVIKTDSNNPDSYDTHSNNTEFNNANSDNTEPSNANSNNKNSNNTNSNKGILVWHQLANTTPKLTIILEKMVSYDFAKRYQSVEQVLQSLEQL